MNLFSGVRCQSQDCPVPAKVQKGPISGYNLLFWQGRCYYLSWTATLWLTLPLFLMLKSIIFPASLSFLAISTVLTAATPLPLWYGQPNTTRQGYAFSSAALSPAASPLENPYGAVTSQVTLGNFSDGWQDPNDPIDLSGVDPDGTWDLGLSGNISVSVPAVSGPAASGYVYRIDFEVYAVGYRGITALPSFSTTGFTPVGLTMTQSTVAPDPLFPGASWDSRRWTGYFDTTSGSPVTFTVSAPANNTSVIDTLEVFTRFTLIPEPAVSLLFFGPAIGLLLRRHRPVRASEV